MCELFCEGLPFLTSEGENEFLQFSHACLFHGVNNIGRTLLFLTSLLFLDSALMKGKMGGGKEEMSFFRFM